ncbi:MAG: hypothetical protein H6577_13785 [Lewinellaceae bacterium]|nr:hypothetical protein [Saprospiraceae bacterium]MCB9339197.1 hypothetical protein [Lewinellaceae bacterium]
MAWLKFNRASGTLELHKGKAPNQSLAPVQHFKTFKSVRQDYRYMCKRENTSLIAMWPAHNNTAKKSRGAWPTGVFDYQYYKPHPEMGSAPVCYNTAYGCDGIHVFKVDSRSGMGVHSGRTNGEWDKVGGVTMGCIRVPANAMPYINTIHSKDKLEAIVVE